jgi:hypothetical protein
VALCPTVPAAPRQVIELLGLVKDLFTGSEHKFSPAIDAGQSPVNEFHNRFLPSRGRVAYDSEWPRKMGFNGAQLPLIGESRLPFLLPS